MGLDVGTSERHSGHVRSLSSLQHQPKVQYSSTHDGDTSSTSSTSTINIDRYTRIVESPLRDIKLTKTPFCVFFPWP